MAVGAETYLFEEFWQNGEISRVVAENERFSKLMLKRNMAAGADFITQ
ncbi:MAG: hypothetical protein NT007_01125 [Candidatus Kapabacteria bacterium]|nr:hypothetical protein [Candidatus Kapabacteria bacterium]